MAMSSSMAPRRKSGALTYDIKGTADLVQDKCWKASPSTSSAMIRVDRLQPEECFPTIIRFLEIFEILLPVIKIYGF